MSVDTPTAVVPEPAEREPASLFRYQLWVHVGTGAEDCTEVDEATGENHCGDPSHFHAWCRTPNQFQHKDIRDQAMAAKARKVRQLKDGATNAAVILEDGLDELRDQGDEALDVIAEEIVSADWWRDYLECAGDAKEVVDPDFAPDESNPDAEPEKLFEHIDDDRIRFALLLGKPEAERDDDEVTELRNHLQDYESEVDRRLKDRQDPRRESIKALGLDGALEQLRRKRIKTIANDEFTQVYSVHEWLSCTYRQPEGDPVFANLDVLQKAPATVLDALNEAFRDLERTAQGDSGN